MAIAGDTFTDTDGTSLVSHTPTGPNAGSGWGAIAGSAQIQSNAAQDSNGSSGNRFRMNNDLGSDEMDVEGVFTSTSGAFVFFGLMGRLQGSGTASGFEFTYDYAVGGWFLTDASGSNDDTLAESWPGGAVTMKLEIRSGVAKGYVNGVEKVSINTSALSGRNYAGILLGNFDGSSPKATVDNFVATGIVAAPAYLPDRPRMHAQLAQ